MKPTTVVIKIGASTIFNGDEVYYRTVKKISYEVDHLIHEHNIKPVLVVSGAVPLGMHRLNYKERPIDKKILQRCACVGQKDLMVTYDLAFKGYEPISQLLFTYDDLSNPEREKNIEERIRDDIDNDIITLINYNDGIDKSEVSFDNDTFGALIANYAKASKYLIVTTVDGLYDKKGNLLEHISKIDNNLYGLCNGANKYGIGGMKTKIDAAKICLENNIEMIIGNVKKYTLKELLLGDGTKKIKRTVFSKN